MIAIRRLAIPVVVLSVWWTSLAQAQSQMTEFTPGPRMIRTLEQIAREYESHAALALSDAQKRAIADLLRGVKKDMWMKEAVLVGIFKELEDKRRYGLLKDNLDYRTANTLTGGIETDELSLFIDTLAKLQGVLTADQRARLPELWQAPLTLQVSQGLTTKIALMSLEGIGRMYNGWRERLHLTDAQAHALRSLLENGRDELLRMGTVVDINRVEGDELALTPAVDPERLREKMTKTGDLEAQVFTKLFDLSEMAEALLTDEQRQRLQGLRRHAATRVHGAGHSHVRSAGGHDRPRASGYSALFLDQIETLQLSEAQVAQLVALREDMQRATLIHQARLKGLELDVHNELNRSSLDGEGSEKALTALIHQVEAEHAKMEGLRLQTYVTARQILTPEQRERVQTLGRMDDGD
jgi:Spy/CpxP family protein refolding chaperone